MVGKNFRCSWSLFSRIPDSVWRLASPSRSLAQPDRGPRNQDHCSPQTLTLRALHLQGSGIERCRLQPAQFTLQDVQDRCGWYETSYWDVLTAAPSTEKNSIVQNLSFSRIFYASFSPLCVTLSFVFTYFQHQMRTQQTCRDTGLNTIILWSPGR